MRVDMQAHDRCLPMNASADRRLWVVGAAGLVLLVVAFRAAFGAYFLLDDFGMLAIARFLENPFEPFYREHIPGGLYYRPVGMLLWWSSERLFGAEPVGHYALNLALHVGVAFALFGLVVRLAGNRWTALAAALVFACHPIGIGTTLWLADRFDLLALLFGLLGLRCAAGCSLAIGPRALMATLLLLALSLLSKEIGLACCAAAMTTWLFADGTLAWRTRLRACLCLLLVIAIYFVARSTVLSNPGAESLLLQKDPVQLFIDGIANWASGWSDYLAFFHGMSRWKQFATGAGLAVVAILAMLGVAEAWTAARRRTVLAGFALWISTALLQWPLLGFQPLRLDGTTNAVEVVLNSRYFYATQAGFLLMLAGLVPPVCARWRLARRSLAGVVVLLVLAWLASAQHLVRSYRGETQVQRRLVESAIRKLDTIDLSPGSCQIYLLDTGDWRFAWVSDEAIKGVIPDLGRIAPCLIQTEHTPWYHIAAMERVDPAAFEPMQLARGLEVSAASLPIGQARFLVLNLDARPVFPSPGNVHFLSWQAGEFVDVTADVREGRRKPAFHCNRRPAQCP